MKQDSTRRYAASDLLRHLWAEFPAERDGLRIYVDRAKSYRNDCGCAMGGFFVVAALLGLLLYGFGYGGFSADQWLLDAAQTAAGLLGAMFIGKITGIGFARIRLVLLGRELRSRYRLREG